MAETIKKPSLKYDVYLAGAMHGRMGYEVLDERNKAKYFCKLRGLTYYDPADDENVDPKCVIDLKPSDETMDRYIVKDEKALDQCRLILVLTGDVSSSGTGWEMARMFYLRKRPIIVVSPKMCAGRLMNFTSRKARKIVSTVSEGVFWAAKILKNRRNR